MGVRIFTLAKELDMTSKELISFLKAEGHKVSSHMSSIDKSAAEALRKRLKPKASGVRVFALAKELNMASKELISFLKTEGHKVSSHMSSIDKSAAKALRKRLKPKAGETPAEKPGKKAG